MYQSSKQSFLRLAAGLFASGALALVIACATVTPQSTPVPPTNVPTEPTALAQENPTHIPRQHSGEHIEGLGEPVDAPHFIDSFPNHSQTLTQSPDRIGINFDVSLAEGSTLTLTRGGAEIPLEAVEFDPRRIYMSALVPSNGGDGLYTLNYRACFAQENCTDGHVGFRVDAARVQDFLDLTNQANVMIHLKDVKYSPHQIIVSQGTTITWVNDDPFEHFVNSDPHPTHNAHPKLNSLDIPPTQTFSYTFDETGEYAFHCSAHVPQNMNGTILVRAPTAAIATATLVAQAETTSAPLPTTAPATTAPTVAPTSEPTVAPAALPTTVPTAAPTTAPVNIKVDAATLPTERFAAHFVSSAPAHADLLDRVPPAIQINFNFVLARNSNVNLIKDGEKLALGALEFSENRLQMTAPLPAAGAGTYHILYRACWPDQSCHDGEFAFVVSGQ